MAKQADGYATEKADTNTEYGTISTMIGAITGIMGRSEYKPEHRAERLKAELWRLAEMSRTLSSLWVATRNGKALIESSCDKNEAQNQRIHYRNRRNNIFF